VFIARLEIWNHGYVVYRPIDVTVGLWVKSAIGSKEQVLVQVHSACANTVSIILSPLKVWPSQICFEARVTAGN
jgi:hypothetical protein